MSDGKPERTLPGKNRPDERLRTPLYHQVYLILRGKILSGEIADGCLIPSEAELSKLYAVSRITVRRAVKELAQEGLVRRRRGAGTHVTFQPQQGLISVDVKNFINGLFEIGKETEVRLLEFSIECPPPDVREGLRLEEGEKVQRTVRARYANGKPFSFIVAYVPYSIARDFDRSRLEKDSLVDLIEATGLKISRAHQTISSGLADPVIASVLEVDVGAPLLTATRVMFDERNHPVEFIRSRYRPDRFQFWIDMDRAPESGPEGEGFVVSRAGRAEPGGD